VARVILGSPAEIGGEFRSLGHASL
jgi:hypothetical protein